MQDRSHESPGEGRRDFLKKAGTVAWVVPTIQLVNMAAASAGVVEGSVVTTTRDPSTTTSSSSTTSTSTTSTSTTTTTQAPGCEELTVCRIKANWSNGYSWGDGGVGANDCIPLGNAEKCNGADIGAVVSGNERGATVTVGDNCEIQRAAHKAGEACLSGSISVDKKTATFTASPQDISHVELIVECCFDDKP